MTKVTGILAPLNEEWQQSHLYCLPWCQQHHGRVRRWFCFVSCSLEPVCPWHPSPRREKHQQITEKPSDTQLAFQLEKSEISVDSACERHRIIIVPKIPVSLPVQVVQQQPYSQSSFLEKDRHSSWVSVLFLLEVFADYLFWVMQEYSCIVVHHDTVIIIDFLPKKRDVHAALMRKSLFCCKYSKASYIHIPAANAALEHLLYMFQPWVQR